jgi:PAS domain S-box-containing protein
MIEMSLNARADELFVANLQRERQATDRLFFYLLLAQWVLGLLFALILSPYTWAGRTRSIHLHVYLATFLGAAVNALPLVLIYVRPGRAVTRHTVAVAQMLWSALFIHLTGGRIETHFHVFGSLAFLAFYRDWRLIVTATLVVAGDHLVRGILWPESVYGIVNPEWWRFLEHAAWVVFEDIVLVYSCIRGAREVQAMAVREASLERLNATIEAKVRNKTAELNHSVERYRQLVESTNAIPWEMDFSSQSYSYISPQVTRVLGLEVAALHGRDSAFAHVHVDDRDRLRTQLSELAASPDGRELAIEYRVLGNRPQPIYVRSLAAAYRGHGQQVVLRGITLDVTAQKELELELHQAQKLESVGRLAAGIAHEINTPVQFVNDSVQFLRDGMSDMMSLVASYRELRAAVEEGTPVSAALTHADQAEDDVDYLLDAMPRAIDRSIDGLQRIAEIVRSMKDFAHPDQKEMAAVDLNKAIASTLLIARNEWEYVADIETDFGELPAVRCVAGELNQVVLNVVVNAAHAIGDVIAGTAQKGRITIRTRPDGDCVIVSIHDTGCGIPEHVRGQIFDPFFTTKEVGKGTGQGLAIARSVVEKHRGTVTFETELGKGTVFTIRLPVDGGGSHGSALAA